MNTSWDRQRGWTGGRVQLVTVPYVPHDMSRLEKQTSMRVNLQLGHQNRCRRHAGIRVADRHAIEVENPSPSARCPKRPGPVCDHEAAGPAGDRGPISRWGLRTVQDGQRGRWRRDPSRRDRVVKPVVTLPRIVSQPSQN